MHGGTIPSELLAGTGLAVTGALHHWLLVPPVGAHTPLVHLARLAGVHREVVPPAPQLTVDRAAHTPLPLLHPVLPHHPQPAPPVPRLHAHRDRGASRAGWAGRHAGVADPPPALPDLPALGGLGEPEARPLRLTRWGPSAFPMALLMIQ